MSGMNRRKLAILSRRRQQPQFATAVRALGPTLTWQVCAARWAARARACLVRRECCGALTECCAVLGHGIGCIFLLIAFILLITGITMITSPLFLINWSYARFQVRVARRPRRQGVSSASSAR